MARRPNIRGGEEIPRVIKRYNKGAFYCNDRDYISCYNYLSLVTNNNPAVDQLFNRLNNESKYNNLKNNQISIHDLIEQDDETMGIFCGGSECGNYYGFGSCGGVCCGVGGLGIGCNIKLGKRERGSTH